MTPGTAEWLKHILETIPPRTKIFIAISGVYFPLSSKIDRVLMTYTKKDDPETVFAEENLCLFPYEGESETPKDIKTDELPKN